VNYRANVWAVRELRPDAVLGINAVGGITPAAQPARLVVPHQLIDYTWGREHTYFDGSAEPVRHVEFDPPFAESVRNGLLEAAAAAGLEVMSAATYGVTQGPRLETAAEIDRLAADGCDVVGMTAMPEAGLARELGLAYAICAVVVNRAAGRLGQGATIHGDLARFTRQGMADAQHLIETWVRGSSGPR
jgi:purine nucleoside phosphorylase